MFGMEQDKEGNAGNALQLPQFSFELENELRETPEKKEEIRKLVEQRISDIRKLIQQGCSEQEFADCENLLQGYLSLATVIDRVKV